MTQPVLDIQQLHLSFPGFNGDVHALNNVSLQINRGEIVGLVGVIGTLCRKIIHKEFIHQLQQGDT
ncbi:hypothetical protein O5853_32540, partial [Escherichia coli]|nr:hypothetical protein [Escherichia coli]